MKLTPTDVQKKKDKYKSSKPGHDISVSYLQIQW